MLIFDDSILDKHRSKKNKWINPQYSRNMPGVIAGISMVAWRDLESNEYVPVDFRLYDKSSAGKTKHDYFREMLKLSISRRLNFEIMVFDI